jgi:hypothetical protein
MFNRLTGRARLSLMTVGPLIAMALVLSAGWRW